jgi:hypothetical protein
VARRKRLSTVSIVGLTLMIVGVVLWGTNNPPTLGPFCLPGECPPQGLRFPTIQHAAGGVMFSLGIGVLALAWLRRATSVSERRTAGG